MVIPVFLYTVIDTFTHLMQIFWRISAVFSSRHTLILSGNFRGLAGKGFEKCPDFRSCLKSASVIPLHSNASKLEKV